MRHLAFRLCFSTSNGRFVRTEKVPDSLTQPIRELTHYSADRAFALEVTVRRPGPPELEALRLRKGEATLWTERIGWWDKLKLGWSCCAVTAGAFSADASRIAIAFSRTVYIYDTISGERAAALVGPPQGAGRPDLWWEALIRR